MGGVIRRAGPAVLTGLALLAGLATPAAARAAPDARLEGAFRMAGTITRADGVRGERRGQKVVRTWRVDSTCPAGPCPTVSLRRARAGGVDALTLRRRSAGTYSGSGTFTIPLRCAGRTYAKGGLVAFSITLRVAATTTVQGTPFATRVAATYVNPRRTNRTPCGGGLGRDGARYSGARSGALPTPPAVDFASALTAPGTRDVTFTAGATGPAPIASYAWSFGDAAAGAANVGSGSPVVHRFSGPGTFGVTLTARDGNGLVGTAGRLVAVP